MRKIIFFGCIAIMSFIISCGHDAVKNNFVPKKNVAFIKDGEVYSINIESKKITQLTSTKKLVVDFIISPDAQYLVYLLDKPQMAALDSTKVEPVRNVGDTTSTTLSADEVDALEEGDGGPAVDYDAVVVYDLKKGKIVQSHPCKTTILYPLYESVWLTLEKLYIPGSNGFEADPTTLDIAANKFSQEVDSNGLPIINTSFRIFRNPALTILTEKNIVYLTDAKETKKTKIFTTTQDTAICAIAFQTGQILWFHKKMTKTTQNGDFGNYTLSIRDTSKKTDAVIYQEKNVILSSFMNATFSPSDSIISINKWNANKDEFTLINVYTKEKTKIEGFLVDWIDSSKFIVRRNSDFFIYDLTSKKEDRIIEGANSVLLYE